MDRFQAKAAYRTFYDDASGCRNGHIPTKRYVSTGNCVHCARDRYSGTDLYRVKLRHDQVALFEQMAKQMGWDYSGKKKPVGDEEDYSDKIPV